MTGGKPSRYRYRELRGVAERSARRFARPDMAVFWVHGVAYGGLGTAISLLLDLYL